MLLRRGGCPAKVVKVAIEPFIDLCVDSVVIVTDLLWGLVFLASFSFCGSSILICAADVNGVVASKPSKSCIHICGEYTSNNVAKVRHVVDIG